MDKNIDRSLVDNIASLIRNKIYTGKYPAGKKLIVRELSEELGVSHTPIKDALNRLVAEGYVEDLPRRSMIVKRYTNSELIDALEARLMCEIFYADNIIKEAREHTEMIAELDAVLEEMRKQISARASIRYEDWVINETKFHRCYMRYCGNEKVYQYYMELDTNKTTYLAYLESTHAPLKLSILEANLIEHQAIADAIRALDARRMINAVIRHILRACDDYVIDEETQMKCLKLRNIKRVYET